MTRNGTYRAWKELKTVRALIRQRLRQQTVGQTEEGERRARQVIELRRQGIGPTEIQRQLQFGRSFIGRILIGTSYAHIPRPTFPSLIIHYSREEQKRRKNEAARLKRRKASELSALRHGAPINTPAKGIRDVQRAMSFISMRKAGMRPREIAKLFRVSETTVYAILNGRSRKYLSRPPAYVELDKDERYAIRTATRRRRGLLFPLGKARRIRSCIRQRLRHQPFRHGERQHFIIHIARQFQCKPASVRRLAYTVKGYTHEKA